MNDYLSGTANDEFLGNLTRIVTGQSTKVVGTADNDHDPVWSRDGTHMAFVRDVASTSPTSTSGTSAIGISSWR